GVSVFGIRSRSRLTAKYSGARLRPAAACGAAREERRAFRRGEVAPAARRESAEPDVHDAHAHEALHAESERRAHAADLPVESLRQHDAERLPAGARDLAGDRKSTRLNSRH